MKFDDHKQPSAQNLKMDMRSFKDDFHSTALSSKIEDNLKKIALGGIYGTPTIIINDKLIFNSASFEDIDKIINRENRL